MKLADSLNPATQAENIKKLNAGLEAVDAKTLPSTSTATTGQILKLTGETKTPSWADEYTPPAYSETEVKTGQKWIDGKDIYSITFSSNYGDSSAAVILGVTFIDKLIKTELRTTISDYYFVYESAHIGYRISTNTFVASPPSAAYYSQPFTATFYYTKPDPVPETRDDDTEPETKKTTKKKTTK